MGEFAGADQDVVVRVDRDGNGRIQLGYDAESITASLAQGETGAVEVTPSHEPGVSVISVTGADPDTEVVVVVSASAPTPPAGGTPSPGTPPPDPAVPPAGGTPNEPPADPSNPTTPPVETGPSTPTGPGTAPSPQNAAVVQDNVTDPTTETTRQVDSAGATLAETSHQTAGVDPEDEDETDESDADAGDDSAGT